MLLSSQSLQVSSVQVRVRVWAKPRSVLKCISRPRCLSCGGRKEGRLKCKELLQWRHSDLKGAMETPVTGWGGPVMLMRLCLQRLTIC